MPSSPAPDARLPLIRLPLVIACHDAGAANLIFAWLREYSRRDPSATERWRITVSGPAEAIFKQSGLSGPQCFDDPRRAMLGAETLLSGSGWASNLEHDARVEASRAGVYSITALDHWVNYKDRFIRNGIVCLPDEVWVGDEYALREARKALAGIKATMLPNLYLKDCADAIVPTPSHGDILYVLEPIHAEWAVGRGGEFEALEFFVRNMRRIDPKTTLSLRLRPHPSDPPGKYDEWIAGHPEMPCRIDDSATLAESISKARVVAGAETFALVVALNAGRTVISTLPPYAHHCRLPHADIIKLRELPGIE